MDRRLSAQEKEEIMTEAYDKAMNKMKECMQEVMSNSGFMETAQLIQEQLKKGAYMDGGNSQGRSTTINNKHQAQTKSKFKINTSNGKGIPHTSRVPVQVDSEITIYRNAVCNGINKQSSSSSEEGGWLNNTSDEQDDSEKTTEVLDNQTEKINYDKEIDNIISESRQRSQKENQLRFEEAPPSTSNWRGGDRYDRGINQQRSQPKARTPTHAERADEVVQEAEA